MIGPAVLPPPCRSGVRQWLARLDLLDGHAVAALVALGRPRRPLTRLTRLPVEEFTSVDRFDGNPFTP